MKQERLASRAASSRAANPYLWPPWSYPSRSLVPARGCSVAPTPRRAHTPAHRGPPTLSPPRLRYFLACPVAAPSGGARCDLHGLAGASTPAYFTVWNRGGGTLVASRPPTRTCASSHARTWPTSRHPTAGHDVERVHHGHAARQRAVALDLDRVAARARGDPGLQGHGHGHGVGQADAGVVEEPAVRLERRPVAVDREVGQRGAEVPAARDVRVSRFARRDTAPSPPSPGAGRNGTRSGPPRGRTRCCTRRPGSRCPPCRRRRP